MKSFKNFFCFLSLLLITFSGYATDYYVDATGGSDTNNGTSTSTAWQSLSKVNSFTFQPGDNILFKAGETWIGQLKPITSGTSGNPITFGKYGTTDYDTRPFIDGNGQWAAIYIYNIEYITVENFEVINNRDPNQYDRKGILVENKDQGVLHGIKLLNNYVHDVKGEMNSSEGSQTGKGYNGSQGIMIATTKGTNPVYSKYDDILVEGNQIIDCDRTGYSHSATWACVTGVFGSNCTSGQDGLFTNVVIKNNYVEKSGGDGILPRGMKNGVVERNLLFDNNVRGSVMNLANIATWSVTCVGAIWQFNEAYSTRGTFDGQSYDLDGGSKDIIFQYNYSHDNRGGFMLVIEFGSTNTLDNIVRYNISENDEERLIHFYGGGTRNTQIYNNTFYVSSSVTLNDVIKGGGSTHDIFNNIFYMEQDAGWNLTSSVRNNIIYYPNGGQHSSSPIGSNGNTNVDPLLISPGSGTTGNFSQGVVTLGNVDGYKLMTGSPAIGSGELVLNNGGLDYFGNSVSSTTTPNKGAYNGSAATISAPTAPFGLTASAQSNTIMLNWVDNSSNESSFVVQRSLTSGSGFSTIATLGANTTSYIDNTISAVTTYYYRVKAANSGGDSAYSNEVNTTSGAITQTTLIPTYDSYVRRGSFSSENYGTLSDLIIKNSGSSSYDRESVLKFYLSSIVSGSVGNAKLRLYVNNFAQSNTSSSSIEVYEANTDIWNENLVTANDINSTGSPLATVTVNASGQYYEWDVTSLVNNETLGDDQVSFLLRNPGTDENWIAFDSKENTNAPQLVITSSASSPPVSAFMADNTTITEGGTVSFTDQSTNSPTSWSWTFAGGTPASSTLQHPVVTYNTPDTYTVSLMASNSAGGGITLTQQNYITVNPSTSGTPMTASPEDDAFVRGGSFAGNIYGSDVRLAVRNSSNQSYLRQSYLKFNVGTSTISDMSLELTPDAIFTSGSTVQIYTTTNNSWQEETLNFNNKPASSTETLLTTVSGFVQHQTKIIDLSPFLGSIDTSNGQVTFLLKTSTSDGNIPMASKEHATSSYRPVLNYTISSGQQSSNGNVILTALEDAYVRRGIYSSNNYGTENILHVKNGAPDDPQDPGDYDRETVLLFELPGDIQTVNSATLRLRLSYIDFASQVQVYNTNLSSFTEETVQGSWVYASGNLIATTTVEHTTGVWYEWDVTNHIAANSSNTYIDLLLKSLSQWTIYFDSKEAGYAPELVIDYVPTGGTSQSQSTSTYQAEDATITSGVVKSSGSGWNGTGYVDISSGGNVEFGVNVAVSGYYDLNLNTTGNANGMALEVLVNGIVVNSTLAVPNQGSWSTNWIEVTQSYVWLNAGSNTIRFRDNGVNEPQMDQLELVPFGNTAKTSSQKGKLTEVEEEVIGFNIYPNPSKERFNITYNSEIEEHLEIKLFDVSGKLIIDQLQRVNKGNNAFKLDFFGKAVSGLHFLQIKGSKQKIVHKVLIGD